MQFIQQIFIPSALKIFALNHFNQVLTRIYSAVIVEKHYEEKYIFVLKIAPK